jgi:hypothetical protein
MEGEGTEKFVKKEVRAGRLKEYRGQQGAMGAKHAGNFQKAGMVLVGNVPIQVGPKGDGNGSGEQAQAEGEVEQSGRNGVEAYQPELGLPGFEDHFDGPAQTVGLECVMDGPGRGRDVGDQESPTGEKKPFTGRVGPGVPVNSATSTGLNGRGNRNGDESHGNALVPQMDEAVKTAMAAEKGWEVEREA